jgi:predicted dehydrogenase
LRSSELVSLLQKVCPSRRRCFLHQPAFIAHIPAILKAQDTISLVAIYSRSASSVEKLVASDAIPADLKASVAQYSGEDGLNELLKRDDVHAVVIALPISKQPEVIKQCLKAGKHVLSEVGRVVFLRENGS